MTRSHGRVLASIWDDPDFQVLSVPAQRLYLLLVSQDSLNNAGRILLTVRRWSNGCVSTSPDDIRKSLAELDEHRFVVVDEDTEEVLIRSFIRNDGIVKQPQMMKNALREALAVKSPRLRSVLADELRKLRREDAAFVAEQIDPGWQPDPGPGSGESTDSPVQSQGSLLPGFDQPAVTVSAGSAQSAELRRGRGRGSSSLTSCSTSVVERAKRATRIPDDFAVTQEMVVWARRECPDVDGRYATAQFVDYWVAKAGKDATKLDWTRTWQTWMRREQRDAARRGPHLRAVPAPLALSDDPAAAFDDLRTRADAQAVANLLGVVWREPAKPPSDPTPLVEWQRAQAVAWIDQHEHAVLAALTERRTG